MPTPEPIAEIEAVAAPAPEPVAVKPVPKPMTEVVIETVADAVAPEPVAPSTELAAFDLTDAIDEAAPAKEPHVELAPEAQARITELP